MILKLLLEIWDVLPKSKGLCEIIIGIVQQLTINATSSAEESAPYISKEGIVAEKRRELNILTTVI